MRQTTVWGFVYSHFSRLLAQTPRAARSANLQTRKPHAPAFLAPDPAHLLHAVSKLPITTRSDWASSLFPRLPRAAANKQLNQGEGKKGGTRGGRGKGGRGKEASPLSSRERAPGPIDTSSKHNALSLFRPALCLSPPSPFGCSPYPFPRPALLNPRHANSFISLFFFPFPANPPCPNIRPSRSSSVSARAPPRPRPQSDSKPRAQAAARAIDPPGIYRGARRARLSKEKNN